MNSGESIVINGAIIKKTCNGAPEQYDIKLMGKNYYSRLRWGFFYISEKPDSKALYEKVWNDKYKSFWEDETEEIRELSIAINHLRKEGQNCRQ